jgi:hypothetical protein
MMNRASKILIAIMAAASPALAQNADPAAPAANPAPNAQAAPATSDASSVVLAAKPAEAMPTPVPDPGDTGRSVSSKINADIASGMPKFAAPTPTPAEAPEVQEARDAERPKNQIPRLPKFVVRESRPLVFRDRDLYTPEGLVNLSFKNHPGLGFGNIFGLNSGIAYDMYMDEQRLSEMNDLTDTARAMSRGGDDAESAYILQASQETFMRPIEETWNGPGGNGGFSGGGGR